MLLRELYKNAKRVIKEGGNLRLGDPAKGEPVHDADEIDLKVHNRTFMVGLLNKLLHDINKAFEAQNGVTLWSPKLLQSQTFLGGSSLHFFNTSGISDEQFAKHKPKVGDIDTQCDKQLEPKVHHFLSSHTNKKIGDTLFLGFSSGNEQFNGLFQFENPPIKIQIDFEFGRYSPETNAPDDWFRFSHNSEWNDIEAGVKGVFHKYLYRSLSGITSVNAYIAKLEGRGKTRSIQISDQPEVVNKISFAVASKQGGGVSEKYRPYIDPNTNQPMTKNGLPVLELVPPAEKSYIQDLNQQFTLFFGRNPTPEDSKLQQSFIGTLDLINKYVSQDKKPRIVNSFLNICFEPGGQMISRDDPTRDAHIKFTAVDIMLDKLGLKNMRNDAVRMAKEYEDEFNEVEAYKKANPHEPQPRAALKKAKALQQLAEAEEMAVKAQLRKGMPHLHDLKAPDFLDLLDELHDGNGRFKLQNIPLNVKVDGFGGRFGKNAEGKPFMGTSRTEPRYQAGFVDYHQRKGTTDPEILGRAKLFDDLFNEMMKAIALVDSTLGEDFLLNKQVTCEVLYLPFATETEDGRLKFVGIHYDKLPQGVQLALVPFRVTDATSGEDLPDSHSYIKKLLSAGSLGSVMFINNSLTQREGLDVTEIINVLDNIEELKRIVSDTNGKRDKISQQLKKEIEEKLQPVKINLEKAIINDPNIIGKDMLGKDYEGIVINSRLGPIKVTSNEQRQVIANKNAAKVAARQEQTRGSTKTAVVAIGSFVGHKGHQQLFDLTIKKAKKVGGDPYLFIGNAVGKDDPIPTGDKIKTWQLLYPHYAKNISTVNVNGGSLLQKIKHEIINPLPGKPPRYDNVILMVGEDQKDLTMPQALMKAVNKFQGYEHVKVSLGVTPRGTGVSFTQLRNALKTQDHKHAFDIWNSAFNGGQFGAAQLPPNWIEHLMNISRHGMGINNQPTDNNPINIKEANRIVREMRAREFSRKKLYEKAVILPSMPDAHMAGHGSEPLKDEHLAGLNHAVSYPSISMNKSNGSAYLQYRFGLALAGSHPDPKQHMPIHQPVAGAFAGDPLLVPYTDADLAIIKAAGDHLGLGEITKLADRSQEVGSVNKVSPVRKFVSNKYGV